MPLPPPPDPIPPPGPGPILPDFKLPVLKLPGLIAPQLGTPPQIGTPPAGGTPPAEGTLPLTVNPQIVLPPGTLKVQPGTEAVEPEVVPELQLQGPILMAPVTPAK